MTAGGPDLTGEMGDRGLAVGAGDGGDRSRLPAAKARRQLRQPAIAGSDRSRPSPGRAIPPRGRAPPHRRSGSRPRRALPHRPRIPAVEPRAGQSGEQEARKHRTQIGGDPDNFRIALQAGCRPGDSADVDQLSKLQSAYLACSPASVLVRPRARNSSTGCTPSNGAMRTMVRPTAGAAVQPAVA